MTIKEAREYAGFTQKQIEEEYGIPERSVQNWEAGVRQPPDYVEEYLIRKLKQERDCIKVQVTESTVQTFFRNDHGDWEVNSTYPIRKGTVPLNLILDIGRYTEAGFRIIYM